MKYRKLIEWLWRITGEMPAYSLIVILACSLSLADDQASNLTDAGTHETARRGNHVEKTGTIRSGLMAAALAPPADDSDKWFVTLVYEPGKEDSEYMRSVIAKSTDIKCWIDANDASKSPTHYQERSITNPTQKDWISGVQPAIDAKGLPMLVLQPPRNGKFGKPTTVVKAIHGIGSGKYIADKFREAIREYIASLESSPMSGGIKADYLNPATAPAPFPVYKPLPLPDIAKPPREPVQPSFDWPDTSPKRLSVRQIQDACPGATASYVKSAYDSKETDLDAIALGWLAEKERPSIKPSSESDKSSECCPVDSPHVPGDGSEAVDPSVFFQRSHLDPKVLAIAAALLAGWMAPKLLAKVRASMEAAKAAKLAAIIEAVKAATPTTKPLTVEEIAQQLSMPDPATGTNANKTG